MRSWKLFGPLRRKLTTVRYSSSWSLILLLLWRICKLQSCNKCFLVQKLVSALRCNRGLLPWESWEYMFSKMMSSRLMSPFPMHFARPEVWNFEGASSVCAHICALPLDAKDLTSALEIVLTLDLATVDPQHLCLCQLMFLFILWLKSADLDYIAFSVYRINRGDMSLKYDCTQNLWARCMSQQLLGAFWNTQRKGGFAPIHGMPALIFRTMTSFGLTGTYRDVPWNPNMWHLISCYMLHMFMISPLHGKYQFWCWLLHQVVECRWPTMAKVRGSEKPRRKWCRWRVVAWNLHPHSARGPCITEPKTCSIPQVENTWALDAKGLFFRASSDPVTLPVSLRICEVKRQACPRYHRRASQRRDNPTPVTQWADEMGAL